MPGDIAGTGGKLLVIGTDYRTAPPKGCDRVVLIEASRAAELGRFRARRDEGEEGS